MSGSGSNGRYGADVATPISTDPFASADYELLWPRELFARELGILRQRSKADERITFLLSEALLAKLRWRTSRLHPRVPLRTIRGGALI